MAPLVYILPVHNEALVLRANVARAQAYLADVEGSVILAVENGSRDASWEIATQLAAESEQGADVRVYAFRERAPGIGFAYHRGLAEALKLFGPSSSVWAVLTGADLPFGFTDAEAARPLFASPPSAPAILIGSKAHPASRVKSPLRRRWMTRAYRVARRVAVGMRVGDSQGSVFLRLDLAAQLSPLVRARGFFYSTELCFRAERVGHSIVELPVTADPVLRASSVHPIRDGLGMARALLRLRHEEARRK
jgi:glycosyltransferase involved in cell wall biosynthesis